jgi:hypothetical protein
VKYTLSKELMDLRNMEKKHRSVKEYELADACRTSGDILEK